MGRNLHADLLLVGITFLWGTSFVVIKGALDTVSPFWLISFRFLIAAAAFCVLFPGLWRQVNAPLLRGSLVISLCLYAGFSLQTLGLAFTTPAKSAFITSCAIVLVPLLERGWLKRRVRKVLGGQVSVLESSSEPQGNSNV